MKMTPSISIIIKNLEFLKMKFQSFLLN